MSTLHALQPSEPADCDPYPEYARYRGIVFSKQARWFLWGANTVLVWVYGWLLLLALDRLF